MHGFLRISIYGVPETLHMEFLKHSGHLTTCASELMNIRAGEILKSHEGQYYRVLEANPFSISLMRVNGQTIFACRPEYIALNFSVPTPEAA
jgi:hypothetical protein